jgi:hypothetical protein
MLRRVFRFLRWFVASVLLVLVVLVGINAMDADPTVDAKALLEPTAAEQATEGNGYVAFLGFGAPVDEDVHTWGVKALAALREQDRPGFVRDAKWEGLAFPKSVELPSPVMWCDPAKAACLPGAGKYANLPDQHKLARERYDLVRSKAEFRELYLPTATDSQFPHYPTLTHGQQLVLLDVALKSAAGDLDGALEALEGSIAFHRKVLAGGRTLICKMIGNTLLARDLLVAAELLAAHRDALLPHRERIPAMLRPLDAAQFSTEEAIRGEYRFQAGAVALIKGADEIGMGLPQPAAMLAPLLFRPKETMNVLAERMRADVALAATPAAGFREAAAAAGTLRAQSAERSYSPINPTGRWLLAMDVDLSRYVARMHDLSGLIALVGLQHTLIAANARSPEAIQAALHGGGGRAHVDPYTGKPMTFDAASGTIGFAPAGQGGWVEHLTTRWKGRLAIAIAP